MADDELDFSDLDNMGGLDWSDVEEDLKKNKEMIIDEASGGGGEGEEADSNASTITTQDKIDIDFLMDVPLELTVQAGRRKMHIKETLEIKEESVIELPKRVGKPMDILINGKLVARGEVIVKNEKFGMKITEIIDQSERLNSI